MTEDIRVCFSKRSDMKSIRGIIISFVLLFCLTIGCQSTEEKIYRKNLSWIDQVVEEEITKENIPGAVVLVGQGKKILYRRCFGYEVIEPDRETMKTDTKLTPNG